MKEKRERLQNSFWVALFISMTFFVFGPLEMIMSNASEFWFSVMDVLPYIGLCAALCFAVVFTISFFAASKIRIIYPVLLGFGLALYVQGNFMFVNYGVMDGTPIDWNGFGLWPVFNTLIWLVLVAVPIVLYLWKKEWFSALAVYVPMGIVAMQMITLITLALTVDLSQAAHGGSASLSVKGINEVSKQGNVAVFILDTFEDTFFEEIIEADPEYLSPLDGFTYFSNSTGVYPTTKGAMPFILSGQLYRNETTYSDYIQNAYSNTDYYKDLNDAGYDIGIYGEYMYVNSPAIKDYLSNLDTSSGVKASSNAGLMGTIYKATAFRYFPHVAKKAVWYYSGDFDSWKTTTGASGYSLYKTGNLDLYEEIKHGELRLADNEQGCYRVFYAYGCHSPYKLRTDMTEIDDGSVTYLEAAKGCLNIVYEYIQQLKELGVYDNTTILVISDHGRTDTQFTSPLMLVKPRNTSGMLQISDAPVSQTDLMATVMEDIGLNTGEKYGRSVFDWKEGESRARPYLYYDWANKGSWADDNLPEIQEYEVSSANNDPTSFRIKNYEKAEYALGDVIAFTAENPTALPYCIYGVGGFEPGSSWLIGNSSCLAFQVNEEIQEDLRVELDVNYAYGSSQRVTITMNNQQLFQKEMSDAETIEFIIPADIIQGGEIELIFDLPDAISPYEYENSSDTRTLSLSISSMVIQNISDAEKK